MLSGLTRKIRQLQTDPVLRRWLVGRVTGRWPGEPSFRPHCPPYLDDLPVLVAETPAHDFTEMQTEKPAAPLTLELAGETVRVEPGREADLFKRQFEDIETLLSLHRFAWLTDTRDGVDPAWVAAIWRAWCEQFSRPTGDWPWHPYTAGERAVNILGFARQHGLPGPLDETISVLAAHAPAIASRLEYFGDHHTSNHLANNGRGLFILGLELGLPRAAQMGARILVEEAKRIFTPTGLLREGSSHYHLLCMRLYESAAVAAEQTGHPKAPALGAIAVKARKATQMLMLPGGLPLIGDISPDISPANLLAALDLQPEEGAPSCVGEGWLRFTSGPWSGLWHTSPEGFAHMPGHGHQDTGGFELHYENEPVFIDPGRGKYGEQGDAALYRRSLMHNTLTVDEADIFPPNRPYYDKKFRRLVTGPAPELSFRGDVVKLRHYGFSRFNHCGMHERMWRFEGQCMTLQDTLEGHRQASITRTLITSLLPKSVNGAIMMKGKKATYTLEADGANIDVQSVTRWRAYGKGEPAYSIRMKMETSLPFSGLITLKALVDVS